MVAQVPQFANEGRQTRARRGQTRARRGGPAAERIGSNSGATGVHGCRPSPDTKLSWQSQSTVAVSARASAWRWVAGGPVSTQYMPALMNLDSWNCTAPPQLLAHGRHKEGKEQAIASHSFVAAIQRTKLLGARRVISGPSALIAWLQVDHGATNQALHAHSLADGQTTAHPYRQAASAREQCCVGCSRILALRDRFESRWLVAVQDGGAKDDQEPDAPGPQEGAQKGPGRGTCWAPICMLSPRRIR